MITPVVYLCKLSSFCVTFKENIAILEFNLCLFSTVSVCSLQSQQFSRTSILYKHTLYKHFYPVFYWEFKLVENDLKQANQMQSGQEA